MNPNPFSDTITFLVQPRLTTAILWVLLGAAQPSPSTARSLASAASRMSATGPFVC